MEKTFTVVRGMVLWDMQNYGLVLWLLVKVNESDGESKFRLHLVSLISLCIYVDKEINLDLKTIQEL